MFITLNEFVYDSNTVSKKDQEFNLFLVRKRFLFNSFFVPWEIKKCDQHAHVIVDISLYEYVLFQIATSSPK